MEKNKQSIVPVKLQDDQKNQTSVGKHRSQRLVARLKYKQAELLIYEGINASTLGVLLAEMFSHEAR